MCPAVVMLRSVFDEPRLHAFVMRAIVAAWCWYQTSRKAALVVLYDQRNVRRTRRTAHAPSLDIFS
jgi:hypothetical protein